MKAGVILVNRGQPDPVRSHMYAQVADRVYRASVICKSFGILSGVSELLEAARGLELTVLKCLQEGDVLIPGERVFTFEGNPVQISYAEEILMGCLGKPSGIATAARRAKALADERIQVVAGGWKKQPSSLKGMVRQAVITGGLSPRMATPPFISIDKNMLALIGDIDRAVNQAKTLVAAGSPIVVQVRGNQKEVLAKSEEAVRAGATIVMVDTGDISDARRVHRHLIQCGLRQQVRIAFGGRVMLDALPFLSGTGVDIVDIGAAILDAPLLDFALEVSCSD